MMWDIDFYGLGIPWPAYAGPGSPPFTTIGGPIPRWEFLEDWKPFLAWAPDFWKLPYSGSAYSTGVCINSPLRLGAAQRAQYGLIKEYTLNHMINPYRAPWK